MSAFASNRMFSDATIPSLRWKVSTTSGDSVARDSSCFGRSGVLTGQKREPIPPASMTINKSLSEWVGDSMDSGN